MNIENSDVPSRSQWMKVRKASYLILIGLLGLIAIESGSWFTMRYLALRNAETSPRSETEREPDSRNNETNALYQDLETWNSQSTWEYRTHLVYRNRPFKSDLVNISVGGIRQNRKNVTAEASDPIFRYWMIGGSGTFGATNADNTTIPASLEQELNRMHPTGLVSVLNLGVGGYTSLQVYLNFLFHLTELETPDLIIVFSGVNDFYRAWNVSSPVPEFLYRTALLGPDNTQKVHDVIRGKYFNSEAMWNDVNTIFDNTTKLFREMSIWWGLRRANTNVSKWRIDYRARRDVVWRYYPEAIRLAQMHYIDNMSALFHVAKQRGIKVLFAQPPILLSTKKPLVAKEEQEFNHVRNAFFALTDEQLAKIETVTWPRYRQHRYWNFDQFVAGYEAQNLALKVFAESVDALYVDMSAAIDAVGALPIFSSAVHYTDEGSAYIAKQLSMKIMAAESLGIKNLPQKEGDQH